VRPARDSRVRSLVTLYEFDTAFVGQYAEHWGQYDPWYRGAVLAGRIGVGVVNVDSQIIDYQEYRRSPFYNDYLRPMNIDRMMNVNLTGPEDDYGPTALSFFRGVGREPFSKKERNLLSRLTPHLCIAAHNYWTAQSMRLLARVHTCAIDAMTSAVFGTEPSGRVAFTNQAADDLLRQRRWLQLANHVLGPSNDVLEATALARALRQLSAGLSFKLVVTEHSTGEQAIVSGAPLAITQDDFNPSRTSSLVWLTPIVPGADVAADLARLFGLTVAERRLVGRLIAGEDLRDAALSLQISLHTVRTQLKSVFAKTGRRTQAALLALAARLSNLRTPAA